MHVTGLPMFALFDSPPGARFCPPGRYLEPVVARRAGEAGPLPAHGRARAQPVPGGPGFCQGLGLSTSQA
jgi:hypothetical protein